MSGRVGPLAQVRALLGLRWQMLRSPGVRAASMAAIVLGLVLVGAGSAVWATVPAEYDVPLGTTLTVLVLAFPVLAVLAGIAAGGGVEIVPSSQLVAYPLSPRAVFLGSLVLAPLNLALFLQSMVILWLSSYLAGPGPGAVIGTALAALYVCSATIVGLVLSWLVTGIRASRRGRLALRATGVGTASVVALLLLLPGSSDAVVTWATETFTSLVVALILPSPGAVAWLVASLLMLGVIGVVAGMRVTQWAMQRGSDERDGQESLPRRRRAQAARPLVQLLRTDLASVWRSRPVRRGIVLLSVVPGVAFLVTAQPWETLLLVPALLATGSALLFSVNVFALDGSGAVWLESLPRDPGVAYWSKVLTTALVVLGMSTVVVLIGALRPRPLESPDTIGALVLTILTATAWATAVSTRQSLRRPGRADLRSARDTPAPPAVMTMHSVRLMTIQITVGSVLLISLRLGGLPAVAAASAMLVAAAAALLVAGSRRWSRVDVRTAVVSAVSSG